jgi:hypothetical protein
MLSLVAITVGGSYVSQKESVAIPVVSESPPNGKTLVIGGE